MVLIHNSSQSMPDAAVEINTARRGSSITFHSTCLDCSERIQEMDDILGDDELDKISINSDEVFTENGSAEVLEINDVCGACRYMCNIDQCVTSTKSSYLSQCDFY